MTDDAELIARLRLYGSKFHHEFGHNDAADRIEQLVATNEALIAENAKLHDHIEGAAKGIHKIMVGYEAKLEKATELAELIRRYAGLGMNPSTDLQHMASDLLEILKGDTP
jgi:hypothetical protein